MSPVPEKPAPFSEKDFYLQEFRGRTIAVAAPGDLAAAPALNAVADDLIANGTNLVVLSRPGPDLERLSRGAVLPADTPALEGAAWRRLREGRRLGLSVPADRPFAPFCRDAAVRLGVSKLVWLDPSGGLAHDAGGHHSFVDADELRGLLERGAAVRRELLSEVQALLDAGVAAVNLCTPAGLADELFTYAGSGTLFTRERYVSVRRLGIDDFDAAHDLHRRGVGEGYLAPRSPEEVDAVLASGFGAFVEGTHLAGIVALLPYADDGVAEIACLYTLTRFLGEGVGGHLVRFALERATSQGVEAVFACTTSERVAGFFERLGFEAVDSSALPTSKWRGYAADRRAALRCYRRKT